MSKLNIKIALAQINTTIGDFENNFSLIQKNILKAKNDNCDLIIFPELAISGYPPKDLLFNSEFILEAEKYLEKVIILANDIAIVIGAFTKTNKNDAKALYNSAIFIENKKIQVIQNKFLLPNYDVFDEERYFEASDQSIIINYKKAKIGLSICEDIWNDSDFLTKRLYHKDPVCELAKMDPDLIINISSSPFSLGKADFKIKMISLIAQKYRIPICHVNSVGANDDLVFDGGSFVANKNGEIVAKAKEFESDLMTFNLEQINEKKILDKQKSSSNYTYLYRMHDALILGIKDFIQKQGFSKVVIGLSGGIDSAITAYLAQRALGNDNVFGILMPSKYSSESSIDDSIELAKNLGIEYTIINIQKLFDTYIESLEKVFSGCSTDTTEENIQARIRGNILMAYSNKFGNLVLATGNKSEFAVGYSTLYGDLAGALAPIGDIKKTDIYRLANFINEKNEIIPKNILTKAPSAELRPEQKDEDSLGSYDELDKILDSIVLKGLTKAQIIKENNNEEYTSKILNLMSSAEFKRNQAPLVLKITAKSFSTGWRMPIVHKFNWSK
ncbi:MAG: NAD+ synthase [Pseudomonadota bacterium]